ncbi:amino acid ABC transporter permease [Paenalcaligenes niemegkensis]|uniref:amino acid ABC transporter permease n=1 Tax=Paenalcaligenes niemegkensis TaxID=2895469 RepID=UPI001EE8F949|nr:amino acid ABC transporter permease [Paenalcaligenes niemegkensis]MCQ9617084.1 amino acid ABC transporter permease [Paenalcaligenes niemegkensis]
MFDYQSAFGAFPLLLQAAQMTIYVSAVGLLVGFIIAIGVASACMSSAASLRHLGNFYVFFFRGVPLIVQLMLAYYFLPFIGVNVAPIVAAIIAISLCEGAYLGEILRGGFMGIPRGQMEATQLLGFSRFSTLTRVQVPQALKLTTPSLINEMILLVKASSLISVVGVAEITRTAQNIVATTFTPLEIYLAAGFVYLIINGLLSIAGYFAERRFGRS